MLPIDGSLFLRLAAERPQITKDRKDYVYCPGLSVVPFANAPKVFNRPHSIVAEVDTTVPIIFGIEGLSCGYDFGEAVTEDYATSYRFTGEIKRVTVDLSGELIRDEASEIAQMMAQQ